MEQIIIALFAVAMWNLNSILPASNWRVTDSWHNCSVVKGLPGSELSAKMDAVWCMPSVGAVRNEAEATPAQPDLMRIIQDIFRSEGVPHNLAWLAQIESDLDPEAVSRAGAVGLFQLMPATAERFGLKVFPVDDRKDPVKSARAAALYLRVLYKEFGEWSLALAAYNAGEGCVRRTLRMQNASTYLEIVPHLPAETRGYVPRVMALAAMREDQKRTTSDMLFMP